MPPTGISSAREVRRIVDVAEATEIDPQIARFARQDENGVVSTDCPLRRSVSIVEEALNPGSEGLLAPVCRAFPPYPARLRGTWAACLLW